MALLNHLLQTRCETVLIPKKSSKFAAKPFIDYRRTADDNKANAPYINYNNIETDTNKNELSVRPLYSSYFVLSFFFVGFIFQFNLLTARFIHFFKI